VLGVRKQRCESTVSNENSYGRTRLCTHSRSANSQRRCKNIQKVVGERRQAGKRFRYAAYRCGSRQAAGGRDELEVVMVVMMMMEMPSAVRELGLSSDDVGR
jgi:hypothetical protein